MWYKSGTVNVTLNSASVVGIGTLWVAQIKPGDVFSIDKSRFYEILSVESNTGLTLSETYKGTTVSGSAYSIIRNFTDTTSASIAESVASLVQKWALREDNLRIWLAGEKNGGPFSDGRYPLTGPNGEIQYVYCPNTLLDPDREFNSIKAGSCKIEFNETTQSLDFNFI